MLIYLRACIFNDKIPCTLTGLVVLGCVEEEPEYRLDDIECALRYNSLDSGIPAEYDEDEVANSINTTLNRSVNIVCACVYVQFPKYYLSNSTPRSQVNIVVAGTTMFSSTG